MKKFISFLLLSVFFVPTAFGQGKAVAYINARIIPIVGAPIEQGVMIVQNGKITAVGDARSVRLSSDVQIVDLKGKVIMPGLVDTHSHIGEGSGADGSSPIQPDVRLLDGLNPRASSLQRAQSGGITTVNVMPGSGHLDSGQTLYIKLRDGANKVDDLLIYDKDGKYMGGIKFANGTNPIRQGGGNFPGTRAKSAALVRDVFLKATEYRKKVQAAGGDASSLSKVLAPHRPDDREAVLADGEPAPARLVRLFAGVQTALDEQVQTAAARQAEHELGPIGAEARGRL